MVNQRIRVFLCLSLHVNAMMVIAIACCILWTCGFWNSMGCTHCLQTVYTRFSFLLWLCYAHIHSIVCYAPLFNSLCGFVPPLCAIEILLLTYLLTKWVRRIYICILCVHRCTFGWYTCTTHWCVFLIKVSYPLARWRYLLRISAYTTYPPI